MDYYDQKSRQLEAATTTKNATPASEPAANGLKNLGKAG